MAFPEQDRFTVKEVADRWSKTEAYVEELLRTLRFKYIIVVEEIGGAPITRHLYFDQSLWIKHYGNKIKEHRDKIRKDTEQCFEKVRKFDGKLAKPPKWWLKELQDVNPKAADEEISYTIGPDEIANLWSPPFSQKEWKRPKEAREVFIPRSTVEGFERKHGFHRERQMAEKIDRGPMPDGSEVNPNKWYSTAQTAKLLSRAQKYVQNSLIQNGTLAGAKKRGRKGPWEIPGHAIISYLEKHRKGETAP